jgi:hypothetical protein
LLSLESGAVKRLVEIVHRVAAVDGNQVFIAFDLFDNLTGAARFRLALLVECLGVVVHFSAPLFIALCLPVRTGRALHGLRGVLRRLALQSRAGYRASGRWASAFCSSARFFHCATARTCFATSFSNAAYEVNLRNFLQSCDHVVARVHAHLERN